MKKTDTEEYFFLEIGPVPSNELRSRFPNGEGSIRYVAKEAFYKMFPEQDFVCSSGWGMSKEEMENSGYARYNDDFKRALIQSYKYEKKKMPRGLRAWELLFQEEEKLKTNEIGT
jgi:hypothetical protein